MEPALKFLQAHGHLIAAFVAGACALTAAYIRRDRRWERIQKGKGVPHAGLLLPPFLVLFVGAGCLAAEYFAYNLQPGGTIGTGDPGTILALVGCVLVAAGILSVPFNFYRWVTWPRTPAVALDPASGSLPISAAIPAGHDSYPGFEPAKPAAKSRPPANNNPRKAP
jgi:hypothetical protein